MSRLLVFSSLCRENLEHLMGTEKQNRSKKNFLFVLKQSLFTFFFGVEVVSVSSSLGKCTMSAPGDMGEEGRRGRM